MLIDSLGRQGPIDLRLHETSVLITRILPHLDGLPSKITDELRDNRNSLLRIGSQCALPDGDHSPALLDELFDCRSIATPVGFELGQPEITARVRYAEVTASIMRVPETTVDEDHATPLGKNDIRPSG